MLSAQLSPEAPICVRNPVDMARLLLGVMPAQAMDSAYMAQDRARDSKDENALRFWDRVVELLA
jgi:hypothetical protein